jgi:hypothetical protein
MLHNHSRRWSDNQKSFYPFTLAKSRKDYGNYLGVHLHSGDNEENKGCNLKIYFLNYTFITELPPIIKPFLFKHTPTSWDAETIKRIGRDHYFQSFNRSYGFRLLINDGHDQGVMFVDYGPQTHDSETTKSKVWFIPFLQWRYHGIDLYDEQQNLFYSQKHTSRSFDELYTKQKECPSVSFMFKDYDGEELTVRSTIQERTWKFGEGWFKWLSWFKKDMVIRQLDLEFSGETGKRKGSYKGGTIGASIAMLPNETHEDAFKRYCVKHEMTYIEKI